MTGLENRLLCVNIGDLIKLYSPQLTVAGFLLTYDSKKVLLSHEDPVRSTVRGRSVFWDCYRESVGRGDKRYNLRMFESFDILPNRV